MVFGVKKTEKGYFLAQNKVVCAYGSAFFG